MNDRPATEDLSAIRRLRRCMLTQLYAVFKQVPYAAVELKQIEEDCRSNTADVNWNMVYLEKCGYVELGTAVEAPPYVASTATLTAAGIDLIEDSEQFDRRFPDHSP